MIASPITASRPDPHRNSAYGRSSRNAIVYMAADRRRSTSEARSAGAEADRDHQQRPGPAPQQRGHQPDGERPPRPPATGDPAAAALRAPRPARARPRAPSPATPARGGSGRTGLVPHGAKKTSTQSWYESTRRSPRVPCGRFQLDQSGPGHDQVGVALRDDPSDGGRWSPAGCSTSTGCRPIPRPSRPWCPMV